MLLSLDAQCHGVVKRTGFLNGPKDTVIYFSVLKVPRLRSLSPLSLEEKDPDPLWRLQVLPDLYFISFLSCPHSSHTNSALAFGLSV